MRLRRLHRRRCAECVLVRSLDPVMYFAKIGAKLGASLNRERIMATTKPRITISLNPHVYATIKRMSQLGKQPMASIISEMLETVHEPLMRTVAFLEAAAEAPKQVRDGLKKSFESVERDLYKSAGHTVAQMDFLTEQLGKPASAVEGVTTQGGTTSADLPPFNYGPDDDEMEALSNAAMGKTPRAKLKVDPPIVIRGSGSTRSGGKKPRKP